MLPSTPPKSRILDEVLQAELISPPKKFQNPPNADLSKYYHYHRNNGHTIEECETLQVKIEELVRVGHLRHYVRNTTEGNPRPQYDKNASKSSQRKDDQKIKPREPMREPRRNQNIERRREEPQQGEGAQMIDHL